MAEIEKEIIEHIGILSSIGKGWKTEINVISWNGAVAKYDIRPWNEDHSKCGRGITLTSEEWIKLREVFKNEQ